MDEAFTVFCRQSDGRGTTWIDTVSAESAERAAELGKKSCAADWGWTHRMEDITVIGVAQGDVKILFWEDLER